VYGSGRNEVSRAEKPHVYLRYMPTYLCMRKS
jgi:hypothetical protein